MPILTEVHFEAVCDVCSATTSHVYEIGVQMTLSEARQAARQEIAGAGWKYAVGHTNKLVCPKCWPRMMGQKL